LVLSLDKDSKTIQSYLSAIDRFFDFLNIQSNEDLFYISALKGREYQQHLKNQGLSNNSINTYFLFLKVFFNWLVGEEKIDKSPLAKVKNLKANEINRAFFSEEEVKKFFEHCKTNEEFAMFGIYFTTGLRRSELINIKLSQLDGYTIHNVIVKRGKTRDIYIPDDVLVYLTKYLKQRNRKYPDNEYLFVSNWGKKFSGEGIRYKFNSILERAGFPKERIEELHVHSTRHTFATNLLSNGENMKTTQESLGHSDIQTTQKIYAHIHKNRVSEAMRNQSILS
jgi:integrase/recombinase XerD